VFTFFLSLLLTVTISVTLVNAICGRHDGGFHESGEHSERHQGVQLPADRLLMHIRRRGHEPYPLL
jgi:hypothetical protein